MKKMVSFFAVFFLLCSLLPTHAAHAAGANDLVKCPDLPGVYYVGDDGVRYVFPNENIYFSWYSDFSEVKTISCEDLASFPLGDRIVYRPGTSLVKVPSDPSVYAVESGGVLREIPSEEMARDLFGDRWTERVDDISEAFWPSFIVGAPLKSGEIPEGTVFEDDNEHLFRMGNDGSATEIDTILDTNDESILRSFVLSLNDIEDRLDITVALTRVDVNTAITILEELLAELEPVRIDDSEIEDVEEVDEIEDDNGTADEEDVTENAADPTNQDEESGHDEQEENVSEDTQNASSDDEDQDTENRSEPEEGANESSSEHESDNETHETSFDATHVK